MSHLSVSQALLALLPAARADVHAAGSRTEGGLSSLHGLGGTAERLAGLSAEAPGMATDMGNGLLRSLDLNPLQAQLAPSLSDTLTQPVTALDQALPGAHSGAGQAPALESAAPSHTLQQMAQAAPHHDIAAERHGSAGERSMAAPSGPTLDANASMPVLESGAELRATPFAREVQVTSAVAAQLYTPDAHLRTGQAPSEPAEEAARRQADRDRRERNAEQDDEAVIEPDAAPACDDAASLVAVQAETTAQVAGALGDPLLYQQIVSALQALRADGGPVQMALDELRRQRRVVLATPAGPTSGLRCQAHVDILRPTLGGGRAVRLAGELLWSQVTSGTVWLEAHVVKSQGQGNVRQLVPVAAQAEPRRIAICLGAQAMPMTAWSQACLRVRDGTRLWRALEPQWSLRLVIGTLPLVLQGQHIPANGAFHAV